MRIIGFIIGFIFCLSIACNNNTDNSSCKKDNVFSVEHHNPNLGDEQGDTNTISMHKVKALAKDSVKHMNSLVLMFDTSLNDRHIQLLIDSNGRHDFLILKVNGIFQDTGIINLDVNTYYPSWNIVTLHDNYGKKSINLQRTIISGRYFYITFGNVGSLRQLFVINTAKMRFSKPDGWTTSLWTYLLGFIVDGDKIVTCNKHPDPTYQYSKMPFSIYKVEDDQIKEWKRFTYNVPSAAVGNDDSMAVFMHQLLVYYKEKYRG